MRAGLGITTTKIGDGTGEMGDYLPTVNLGSGVRIVGLGTGELY